MQLSRRAQVWLDLVGHRLLPAADRCSLIAWLSWPFFLAVLGVQETIAQRRRPHPLAGEAAAARRASCCSPCRACPRSSSASRACAATIPLRDSPLREAAAMIPLRAGFAARSCSRGSWSFMLIGLPGRLLARGPRPRSSGSSASSWASSSPRSSRPSPGASSGRSSSNELLLAIPFFTFMGADPREVRPRRGHARRHGPALRPRARRPGLSR